MRRYRPAPEAKPAIVLAGSKTGRTSQREPFSTIIEQALLVGLSAQRICFVRRWPERSDPPIRRMEGALSQELLLIGC